MSIAGEGQSGKSGSLVEMTRDLAVMAERAAVQATLYEFERAAFDKLLEMGRVVIDEFLALQGGGNLGETVTTDKGQTLHRSSEPVARPLRTIFGQHKFFAFVYRERTHPNSPIVFRPIDTRMSLPPGAGRTCWKSSRSCSALNRLSNRQQRPSSGSFDSDCRWTRWSGRISEWGLKRRSS